ncbi:MAG: prolyl oligopeptidase family serine peptidase [Terracidiphilus sp.]
MKRRIVTFLFLLTSISFFASNLYAQAATAMKQPVAPVRPITDDYFGTKVVDNYRWMENLKDTEMQRWMKVQADYTRATLDALPGYPALLKRVDELNMSEPAQVSGVEIVGGRYYSLRTPKGAQSPKLYVRDGVKGDDRLLIDSEKLSTGTQAHLSIQGYRPSPDGRYVAYQLAGGGSEESVLHILDVKSGRDLAEIADRAYGYPPFWRADSKSFFYRRGQKLEPGMPKTAKYQKGRVYLHKLGREFDDDPPIIGRGVSDPAIALTPIDWVEIATAPGSHYAVAAISPGTESRLRVYAAPVDAVQDGKTAWRPVAASSDDQYISGDSPFGDPDHPVVALTGDTLYWLSRKDAPRGRILKLDLADPRSKPEIAVAQGDLPISEVYAGRDAIYWRVSDAGVNSVSRLRFARGAKPETLRLPYPADIVNIATDGEGDATALLALSWLRSNAYLGVDVRTGAVTDTDLQPAGPYDHLDDLAIDEVKVKSWDGVEVPLSIVHGKGLKLDGDNPTIVTGYGAYGISSPPRHNPAMRAWYERGGVRAIAHVRGGGEYGEAWHQAGFQATKPNTWTDFIACAQYLVDHKYTNPHKLIGFGGSAGGILIGRAIEERPDLFTVAIVMVPLADTLRFEATANGPRNVAEFGSVKTEAGFKALYSMSPYAHVQDGSKYPAVMIMTGINDPRVAAWIPAKFAARLQAATKCGKPVLLRVDYNAGHGFIDATRLQGALINTDMYAFALWQTGDPDFQPTKK